MYPGFDFQTQCHMWVEFVGSLLCSEKKTIYTMHPGGNFRCKYSVLQLFQTQNGKMVLVSIIGKFKRKRKNALIKSIANNF